MSTDLCTAWAEAGRGFASRYLVLCRKPADHDGSHYDLENAVEWSEDATGLHLVRST